MIDYDMLFAEGNFVALKNTENKEIYYHFVEPYEKGKINWDEYYNKDLSRTTQVWYGDDKYCNTTFQVMYIAKLNFDDKIISVLYDRNEGVNKAIKNPMPKLLTGYFVELYEGEDENKLGTIIGDKIIYQDGGFDYLVEFDDNGNNGTWRNGNYYITKIWDNHVTGFDNCTYEYLIWQKEN